MFRTPCSETVLSDSPFRRTKSPSGETCATLSLTWLAMRATRFMADGVGCKARSVSGISLQAAARCATGTSQNDHFNTSVPKNWVGLGGLGVNPSKGGRWGSHTVDPSRSFPSVSTDTKMW